MCRNQNLYGDYLVSHQLVNSNNMVELSSRQSLKNIQKEKPMRVYFNKLKKLVDKKCKSVNIKLIMGIET
jgi:hypothetical protein